MSDAWEIQTPESSPFDLVPSQPDDSAWSGSSSSTSDHAAAPAVLLSPDSFVREENILIKRSAGFELEGAGVVQRDQGMIGRLIERSKASDAFTPTHTQYITIYIIEAYFVFMLLGWNLLYVRSCLFPFKLLTVGFHESCHAIMGTLTGAKVESIILDPNQANPCASRSPPAFQPDCSLSTGRGDADDGRMAIPVYTGSTTIGAALICCGFDEYASKIACFPILALILLLSWWARKDWFTLVNVSIVSLGVGMELTTREQIFFPFGLLVCLFVIEHAAYLRFLILFIGVMNGLELTHEDQYAVWDILDDLVFQKIDESDCSAFTRIYPWMPAQAWGAIWFLYSFSALCTGVILGLVFFKDNFEQQQIAAESFIPTR
ncbi:hypothetical protein MNV49_004350 [Pseudohyphozyma bogoriensis]|nr:hypothetical protein MNV49_004350 [Pseudohyphozyma bogoriensis]